SRVSAIPTLELQIEALEAPKRLQHDPFHVHGGTLSGPIRRSTKYTRTAPEHLCINARAHDLVHLERPPIDTGVPQTSRRTYSAKYVATSGRSWATMARTSGPQTRANATISSCERGSRTWKRLGRWTVLVPDDWPGWKGNVWTSTVGEPG